MVTTVEPETWEKDCWVSRCLLQLMRLVLYNQFFPTTLSHPPVSALKTGGAAWQVTEKDECPVLTPLFSPSTTHGGGGEGEGTRSLGPSWSCCSYHLHLVSFSETQRMLWGGEQVSCTDLELIYDSLHSKFISSKSNKIVFGPRGRK